jgi:GT2 family glycosyltransferase
MFELALVIPNYNGKKRLKACLVSVYSQNFPNLKVIVVDNGSTDGSAKMIKRFFPQTQVISLPKNLGFAGGMNVGIRVALKEKSVKYVCSLNNDIVLAPGYFSALTQAAANYSQKNIHWGLLGAKLLFQSDSQIINTVGTLIGRDGSGMEKGFKEEDQGQYNKTVEIFGACGAAVLYKREMLQKTAYQNKEGDDCYFDEDFFAYYEDLDLNYRSRLLGFSAFYVPQAVGYHAHSATGKSFSPFKSFHVYRNQIFVLLKDFPLPFLFLGFLILPFRYIMLLVSVLLGKGPSFELSKKSGGPKTAWIAVSAWGSVLKHLPRMLKKRWQIQKNRKISNQEFNGFFKKYRADFKKMIFG